MRLLIELPELIEDSVMISPAIENLLKHYKNAQVTFLASNVSSQFYLNDKRINNLINIDTNKGMITFISLFNHIRFLEEQDLVISFNKTIFSKFFMFFVKSENKYRFLDSGKNIHIVEKYNEFINSILKTNYRTGDLMLRFKPQWYKKRTLGIHPGSTYADTKRWDAQEFAKVASSLSFKYDIVLLGGKSEVDICSDIENILKEKNINNYENLAGKTSIPDLIEKIAAFDLFLTIDSGPMQIAAVYKVNTLIIPTSYDKIELRNQWRNPLETIVYKESDPYCEEEPKDYTPSSQDVLRLFNL